LSLLAFSGGAIQLVPDGTLLFHMVLIVVMVGLLNATLLKPINRVLEERERRTKGRAGEARDVLDSVDEKMREYQVRLREARGSGYRLLEELRSAASKERAQKVSNVKEEVTKWRDEETRKLEGAGADVKDQLSKDVRKRATEIGAQILGRPVRSLD
jgi:F-type H+-transporting ATPase subunit b